MQMFTQLPIAASHTPENNAVNDSCEADAEHPLRHSAQPIWPDYFARIGQADALSWHYQGYWSDTLHVWSSYYRFVCSHPVVAYKGLRQFYRNLSYRVFGAAVGDRSAMLLGLLSPVLLVLTPLLALVAVSIASIPAVKRHMPPLFQPFSLMGWCNYCVMLSLVFMLHGYRQYQTGLHPTTVAEHSSKNFWNSFFNRHLPADQFATEICATCIAGTFFGKLPTADLVVKPNSAGAGYRLRSYDWQANGGYFRCNDSERDAHEVTEFTPQQLQQHILTAGMDMVIERRVRCRSPLPISSLRILTLHAGSKAELISAAFLPAPQGSVSTAYFDLDVYLVDYRNSRIGEPLAVTSDGALQGLPLPELNSVIATCLQLHERLKEHVQISWDVLLAPKGPVFLEGNVFPPGCDYKLTLFKNKHNFRYLSERLLGNPRTAASAAETASAT